jgi:hypothetical protein
LKIPGEEQRGRSRSRGEVTDTPAPYSIFMVENRIPWDRIARYVSPSPYISLAPTFLQRLPFSSDYHSPAPTILQRLPFSHSPAPTILQRLQSPAPTSLQRLPVSSACQSPAPTSNTTSKTSSATSIPAIRSHDRATFLWPLLFSGHYLSPATFSPVLPFSGHYLLRDQEFCTRL